MELEEPFCILLPYFKYKHLYTGETVEPGFHGDLKLLTYWYGKSKLRLSETCDVYTLVPGERIPRVICTLPYNTANKLICKSADGSLTCVSESTLKAGIWIKNALLYKKTFTEPKHMTSIQAAFAVAAMYHNAGVYCLYIHNSILVNEKYNFLKENDFQTELLDGIQDDIDREIGEGITVIHRFKERVIIDGEC